MISRALIVLLLSLMAACSNVERITLGVCGNHIVDEGETCDGTENCTAQCQLSCGIDLACPAGLGCDLGAGQCRAAKGSFTSSGLLASSEGRPYVADFDGDQRDDLLVVGSDERESTASNVYFFDPGVLAPTVVGLPRARSVVTADVARDRLVLLGGSKLLGYRALPGRVFSPVPGESRPVAANTRLFSVDFDADGRRDIAYLEGKTLSVLHSLTEAPTRSELGVDAAELIRHELNDQPLEPLETVSTVRRSTGERAEVLALFVPGQSSVQVYGMAEGETMRVTLLSSVAVPEMFFQPNGLFAGDVDLDGRDDLLLAFGVGTPLIAYGLGAGTFGAFSPFDDCNCQGILGVGHFDRDPALDIYDGAQNIRGGVSAENYVRVLVADLTGDGLDDVVAVSGERGFDVLRGHPTGSFSRVPIGTTRRPKLREIADLDGDGQPDVVLTESNDVNDADQISLLFSPVTAASTGVSQVARIPHIQQIVAGYLSDPFGNQDAYADLAVLHATDDGDLQLAFLEGGLDRQLRAPLATEDENKNDDAPRSSRWPAIGHFRSKATTELVTVLAANDGSTALTVRIHQLGADGTTALGEATLTATGLPDEVRSADLDADGIDELYVLFVGQSLLQVQLSGSGSALQARETTLGSDASAIVGADIDGDGQGDFSVIRFDRISVLFATNAASPRTLDITIPDAVCGGYPSAHAWIQADADPELELALNCLATDTEGERLYLLDVDLETGEATVNPPQTGVNAKALVVGDFNGDGVQDLASANGDVAVLFGKAR